VALVTPFEMQTPQQYITGFATRVKHGVLYLHNGKEGGVDLYPAFGHL
jgi:hypothetical protein